MKLVPVAVLLAFSAAGANTVTRASLQAVEKSFDRRLEREVLDNDQFLLLGMTRAVYVPGFGVVYSAEVNLAPGLVVSPFRPEISKDDLANLRKRKLERLPVLRQTMKQMLLDGAASLDGLPAEENMVLGVSLFMHPREDSTGLPSQIVMQAQKKVLLDFQTGRRPRSELNAAIRVEEY